MGNYSSIVFGLILYLLFSSSGGAEKIRVASYNVRNYLVMDRIVSGRWQEDYPKPLKERRIIRSVINQTNPDILAIQEMGEPVYLQSSIFSKKEFSSIRNYNPYKIEAKYDEFKINASKELDWIRVAIEGQEYLKLQFEESVIFLNESSRLVYFCCVRYLSKQQMFLLKKILKHHEHLK